MICPNICGENWQSSEGAEVLRGCNAGGNWQASEEAQGARGCNAGEKRQAQVVRGCNAGENWQASEGAEVVRVDLHGLAGKLRHFKVESKII